MSKRERETDRDDVEGETEPAPDSEVVEQAESDDDDDFGPMPANEAAPVNAEVAHQKKRRILKYEGTFLENLPCAEHYYKSFMHRDAVNYVTVSKTEFLITCSEDGHLKLWKKQAEGIEFVKHYRAHLGPVRAISCSEDGSIFATIGTDPRDRGAKIFDIVNFDMINQIKFDFVPKACCWISRKGQARALLAVSDANSPKIHIFDARGSIDPIHVLENIHRAPVHIIIYSDRFDTVLSADESGMIETWTAQEPFDCPSKSPGMWSFKSKTDLYEFKKNKVVPTAITLSPNAEMFASYSITDRQIRIFEFASGKLIRKYDESLSAAQDMQQRGSEMYRMDDMEFGRRLAVEKEIEKQEHVLPSLNIIWDESANFIIYATLFGIKVVNIITNKVVRLLGKDEAIRFTNVALYQGVPVDKSLRDIAMAASDNPLLNKKLLKDPTLFCAGYKRQRFYMLTRSEPIQDKNNDRDIYNERPTADERAVAVAAAPVVRQKVMGRNATIHTDMGDITLELFTSLTPKTIENFCGLARNGYYENTIIHRVIPKFMIQMGDPLGDGTGGESLWGSTFEDEFVPSLNHSKPYMLSMANAGPNTNGSQFFITTVPCPWLDKKHTVFGRATGGFQVLHKMEALKTDKRDKPLSDVKLMSIDID